MRVRIAVSLVVILAGCSSEADPRLALDAGRDGGQDAPVTAIDAGPETEVTGGEAVGDWCGAVHVSAPVNVPTGATLTVCAGSIVRFDDGVGMNVAGTLVLAGTRDARVTLRSNTRWSGITVDGTLTASFADLTEAETAIDGGSTSAIAFEDGAIYAAGPDAPVVRLAHGGRFDRSALIGGNTIPITGGILEMTDSFMDQLRAPSTPDCTDWNGGGMRLDHVHITGCHCPIHINRATGIVSITNSILDGSKNPIMIASCTATIHHNHFAGTSTLVLDIGDGNGIDADLADNYWEGGPPNVGTRRPDQFTGTDMYSTTPFDDVGPR